MNPTLFLFGRTPELSYLELTSIFPAARRIVSEAAILEQPVDYQNSILTLGGTVKVAEVVDTIKELTESAIFEIVLHECKDEHITFGISGVGGVRVPSGLASSLKKMLTERGIIARFVTTKHDEALSSVVIKKQHVTEFVVLKIGDTFMLGVTRAVQDFEDWNKRDFGRPAPDPKSGMLPPKVARMIVNVALPHRTDYHPTLLDPFCGSGTIIQEALLRGAAAIGTDVSEKVIDHTKKNISWLKRAYPETASLFTKIFVADATHLSDHIARESVDAIATEPYMGDVIPGKEKDMLKGLEKLYIGSLREWATIIKPGGRVVMAIPAYVTPRGIMRVKNVIDRCEILGYTLLTGPIEYSRPQAIVKREFFVFLKK